MNNPRVSVIITTYKRPFYAKRAYHSASCQTYKPFEIIIVNDDPSTIFNPTSFSGKIPPLVINHTKNIGASGSRNSGISRASGDILCFLDDDDLWLPTYILSQVESLCNSSNLVGFSYTHSFIINDQNKVIKQLQPRVVGNIFDIQLISHCITNISCVAIKANVLNFVPEFDVKLPRGNDSDFIRQLSYFFHCVCVEESLVLYNYDFTLPRITSFSRNGLDNAKFSLKYRFDKYLTHFSVRPIHIAFVLRQLSFLYLRSRNYLVFCFYFILSFLPSKFLKSSFLLKKISSL